MGVCLDENKQTRCIQQTSHSAWLREEGLKNRSVVGYLFYNGKNQILLKRRLVIHADLKMSSVLILYYNFHLPEKYNRVRLKRIKANFVTPKLEITGRNIMLNTLHQECEVRVTRKKNPYLNPPITFK